MWHVRGCDQMLAAEAGHGWQAGQDEPQITSSTAPLILLAAGNYYTINGLQLFTF